MSNLLQKASIVTTPTAYGVGVLNSIKPAYALGENLVVNGTFDTDTNWTKGTGWSISNGKAIGSNSSSSLYQATGSNYTSGKTYKIVFTVSDYVSGSVRPEITNIAGEYVTSNGTFTQYIVATSSAIGEELKGASFTGSIDNVSVVEVTDADFDFTRTSSAVRVAPNYLLETVSINSANLIQNGNFSELGSELVTNGNFATDLSGWGISGNSDADHTVTWTSEGARYQSTTTSPALFFFQNVLTSGKTYKFTVDVAYTSGAIKLQTGSGADLFNPTLVEGTNTFYFTASNTQFLFIRSSTNVDVLIDNVSVKQVDTNDNWALVGESTITNTLNIISTDGSLSSGKQLNVLEIGKKYKYSFDITSYTSGSLFFIEGSATVLSGLNATGTYTGQFISTGTSIEFKRGGVTNASFDNISIIEIQENGVPRLDYTNGTASILIEPQSTNLLTYSNDFSQSVWNKQSGVTATYNTTETLSPDGTYNATKLIGNGTTGIFTSVSVSGVVSRSIYIKSVTGNVNVILKDPQNTVTQKTLNVTTQWQRFELVEDNTISSQGIWVDDIPSSGIYIYGAQIESQSYTTSYIPTDGSSVTRASETLNNAGNSDLINSTEGTLYLDIASLVNDGTIKYIGLNDGSSNNRVVILNDATDNNIRGIISSGGTKYVDFSFIVNDATNFHKIALKYKANDFALWIDGVEVASDSSGLAPIGLNDLEFSLNGSGVFYSRCKTVAVFKEALSDTELACLTSTNNREIFLNYYYRMQYVGANTEALSCAEKTFNI